MSKHRSNRSTRRLPQGALTMSAIAVATGVSLHPAPALAAANAEAATLEDIVVTARRVEESQQDTPIAITAISGESLEDRQIFQTDQLTQVVPNLQFGTNAPLAGNNASSQVFIRGIGQTDPTSTVDPGVGLYIDDVYIGTAVGARMGLRDIGNVQVLRGPQGTLFGRNTIGGAVLLSTADPGRTFGATGRGTVGSDNLVDGFVGVDAPVSDSVLTRFTAGMRKQDGYVHRTDGTDLGDTNTYTLTGKVLWEPSEGVHLRWLADYSHSDEHGSPLVFSTINTSATFPRVASFDAGCPGMGAAWNSTPSVPNINDTRCANNFQSGGPFHTRGTAPLVSKVTSWGTSVNLHIDLNDAWSVKFISAYRDQQWLGNRDGDNTPLPILHTFYDVDGWQWSEELQATFRTERTTGVAGIYYFKQRSNDTATIELNPPTPGVQRDSDNNIVDNESWALFTQWTYSLTEALSATGGIRYTEDKKGSYPDQYDLANPTVKQVPVRWYRDTFSDTTMSASLNYRWNPQAMSYLSYSEGFKGGGWNSHFNSVLTTNQQAALHSFQPETAETWEVGSKFDLVGRTLRLNIAAFQSDYTDMQITYRGPAPSGVAPFVTNAGKASIEGGELELTWIPVVHMSIDASIARLRSRIDRLDIAPEAVRPAELQVGNDLPYAPRWQTHLGAEYAFTTRSLTITPRIDMSYQGRTYFDATNTPQIAQLGGYTTYNTSLVIKPLSGSWRVNLGVNNAGDKVYRVAGNSSLSTGSGYAEVAYARPREYFGTVSWTF